LQLYIGKARRGYTIVETGLKDIGNIHGAEYALHEAYFGSLAAVNPKIAAMPEVEEIIQLRGNVSELADVLTPGKLVMTDGERMARILALDAEARRK
jgi:hypothetical protein